MTSLALGPELHAVDTCRGKKKPTTLKVVVWRILQRLCNVCSSMRRVRTAYPNNGRGEKLSEARNKHTSLAWHTDCSTKTPDIVAIFAHEGHANTARVSRGVHLVSFL